MFRKRILENEKFFLRFLYVYFFFLFFAIFWKFYLYQLGDVFSFTFLASALGPFVVLFFGYLNFRMKIANHDLLVKQYNNAPPPPKDHALRLIIRNAKFVPTKIDILTR